MNLRRLTLLAVAALGLSSGAVPADGAPALPALSVDGTALGRITADTVQNGLAVTVDLGADAPQGSYVVARFQNDQPLMLGADGLWAPWNGGDDALEDSGFSPAQSQLTFQILAPGISDLFWPVAFTLAYRTADGLKSGTLVVDEPAP